MTSTHKFPFQGDHSVQHQVAQVVAQRVQSVQQVVDSDTEIKIK